MHKLYIFQRFSQCGYFRNVNPIWKEEQGDQLTTRASKTFIKPENGLSGPENLKTLKIDKKITQNLVDHEMLPLQKGQIDIIH